MSENELNKYRLTSLEEPSDEMLHQIMHEIAAEVRAENEAIDRHFLNELREAIANDKKSVRI